MLPSIFAKSAPDLGGLCLPVKLIDNPTLPDRLAVHGILESFDHGLEMLEAFLQGFETGVILVAPGAAAGAQLLSDAKSTHHAIEHPR